MRAKDMDDSQRGVILPDRVLSYEIVAEGDIIRELVIRNYGTRARLRELVSSTRWTFDKMYENIHTNKSM
jgi:hypothetical protein